MQTSTSLPLSWIICAFSTFTKYNANNHKRNKNSACQMDVDILHQAEHLNQQEPLPKLLIKPAKADLQTCLGSALINPLLLSHAFSSHVFPLVKRSPLNTISPIAFGPLTCTPESLLSNNPGYQKPFVSAQQVFISFSLIIYHQLHSYFTTKLDIEWGSAVTSAALFCIHNL
jgi:hypothetical protein